MADIRIVRPPVVKINTYGNTRSELKWFPRLRVVKPPILRIGATLTGPLVLSGTITKNAEPVAREVYIYRDRGCINFVGATMSAADGSWSFTVPDANASDRFTVVAQSIGLGENNQIRIGIVE